MNWPIKLQAPSCKHLELDRSLDQGYNRIKKKETRTYAQLNASRPRTVVTRRNKPARARNWQPRPRVLKKFPRGIAGVTAITKCSIGHPNGLSFGSTPPALDPVISKREARTASEACTGSGPKILNVNYLSNLKLQASSHKLQAPSNKLQAPSHKLQAP
jgi:hypothetical protein